LGADGGGSIRTPASFCGIVGLKSTYGRISEFGAAPLTWSMGHLGPLTATATDAALAYAALAGPDPKDPVSLHQPAPDLTGWDNLDLSGVCLGVYPPWFEHATGEVVRICQGLLNRLQEMGARVREIAIPDLEAARVAHVVTIAAEMCQALAHTAGEHGRDHGLAVRMSLALAREFTALDYIQAQRIRTRTMAHFAKAMEVVDAIVTPTTAMVAPPIPEAALRHGDSDLTSVLEIIRFVTPANLTGLPAISFPAGYSEAGLPVGMQAIGRPWEEPVLLRLALAAEQVVERRAPEVHFSLLEP
jgi:Asp-tRNA(Asn)/Glu-tRNA(Gln) amidotransferase A subunit family amidase